MKDKKDNLSRIRKLFKDGAVLTVKTCTRRVGTTELRHYVSMLEAKGLHVYRAWQTKRDGTRFMAYWT